MNQYNIRLTLLEYISHTRQDTDGHICQILNLLHDIEVNIRFDIKYIKNLVEHFTMLTCNSYYGS